VNLIVWWTDTLRILASQLARYHPLCYTHRSGQLTLAHILHACIPAGRAFDTHSSCMERGAIEGFQCSRRRKFQTEGCTMSVISMKSLLEAGVHFGHRTRRWHPKMRTFIFTERNGIHIIDLRKPCGRSTPPMVPCAISCARAGWCSSSAPRNRPRKLLRSRLTAVHALRDPALARRHADQLPHDSEPRRVHGRPRAPIDAGELDRLPKKEALLLRSELARLETRIGGLRNMGHVPDALFVVDVTRESLAVKRPQLHIPSWRWWTPTASRPD